MWVFQPFGSGFELLIEGGKRGDLAGGEGDVDRLWAAVPRLQELDGDDGSLGGDGDQFEEPVSRADLTVFELEALCLKDAEELLDDPALFVPFDDAPSVLCIGDPMRGEKPPMQRLDPGFGVDLAYIND